MASQLLAMAKAKVHRAEAQIENLDREIRAFVSTNRYDITTDLDLYRTERIWRFRLQNRDTTALSVLTGEIGHNLRSSLDNLMCAIAQDHAGRRDRTSFPFGKTLDIFESEARKKTKDLPTDAIDMIRELRPYKGGNELLWAIHELNRDDKHRGPDPVLIAQGMMISGMTCTEGNVLIVGDRHGKHYHARCYTPKINPLEAVHEDGEFLTTTPDAQVRFEGQPTFQVTLRDIEGFKGEPVFAVLHQMRDLVEDIFLTFGKRFF